MGGARMTQMEALRDGWRRPGVKWLVAFTVALLVIVYLAGVIAARAEAARTVSIVMPIDVIELMKTFFTGVAAIGGIFVSIYLPVLAGRQKRAEVALAESGRKQAEAQLELSKIKDNVVLIERNTNSLTKEIASLSQIKGEQIGKEKERARTAQEAQTLEEGKRLGVESERASPGAPAAPPPLQPGKKPIDVADDRTARAVEETAADTKRIAAAQERTADATEKKG